MMIWALTNGFDVPENIVMKYCDVLYGMHQKNIKSKDTHNQKTSQDNFNCYKENIGNLVHIHGVLKQIIRPAKPRTVTLIYREQRRRSLFIFLGPVPLIRQLVLIAVFFLCMLYSLGQFSEVNVINVNLSILHSEGSAQLKSQGFLLACAGLGSIFSGLFQAMEYVTKGTYDPKYNASYWVRVILGLMSGLILVEMIPDSYLADGPMQEFGKPTIALLGGFSATVVHKLLQKIVDIMGRAIDQIPGGKNHDSTESFNVRQKNYHSHDMIYLQEKKVNIVKE